MKSSAQFSANEQLCTTPLTFTFTFTFNFNEKQSPLPMSDNSNTPVERFLDHCDLHFKQKPEYFGNKPDPELQLPGVTGISYQNAPEPGFTCSLSYGLSRFAHPDRDPGKRCELLLVVKSLERSWSMVTGFLAHNQRGKRAFLPGETIDFGVPISDQSGLDAFLVAAPPAIGFEPEAFQNIDIGTDYLIDLVGLYPIYAAEIAMIEEMGAGKFLALPELDIWDLRRKSMAKGQAAPPPVSKPAELVPPMGSCFVSHRIMKDGQPVRYMLREEPDNASDSGWRFTAGTEDQAYADDPKNWSLVAVNTVAVVDPAIVPYVNLPTGTDLERIDKSDEFKPYGS